MKSYNHKKLDEEYEQSRFTSDKLEEIIREKKKRSLRPRLLPTINRVLPNKSPRNISETPLTGT